MCFTWLYITWVFFFFFFAKITFLNQEGFFRQVKMSSFQKIICQRGKQNNVISNRKHDYFSCRAKTLILTCFFLKTGQFLLV